MLIRGDKIKLSELSEKFQYPKNLDSNVRLRLQEIHRRVVASLNRELSGMYYDSGSITLSVRVKATNALNVATYYVLTQEYNPNPLPVTWDIDGDVLGTLPEIEDDIDSFLSERNILFTETGIVWDFNRDVNPNVKQVINAQKEIRSIPKQSQTQNPLSSNEKALIYDPDTSEKENLRLQPPEMPMLDTGSIKVSYVKNNTRYVMYESLPRIPEKQREISATTDVNLMSDADLLKLFPKTIIKTRFQCCYERYDDYDMRYDDILGNIFRIQGFTEEQIIDNIIKYPHFYNMKKIRYDVLEANGFSGRLEDYIDVFYPSIEIDGEIKRTMSIWDELDDAQYIPRVGDLIKEYVIRRYLLERDVAGIKHKCPMFGELNPFVSLVFPPSVYVQYGYSDPVELARKCVQSRVAYWRSRNPIILGLESLNN